MSSSAMNDAVPGLVGGRRLVASRQDGRSGIVLNEELPDNRFEAVPSFNPRIVWGTAAEPTIPWDGRIPTEEVQTVLTDVGGTRLFVVTFPPDSVMLADGFDPARAGAEYLQRLPGLAELFEPDNPGMHATPTIDYDVVLDGEITVEFDDGESTLLRPGDVLVQYGTRHAWRNHTDRSATMLFVLIGASCH